MYFLRNKSEALEKFKIFRIKAFNETNNAMQHLHADNGGEYMSKEFQQYLIDHNIEMHNAAPYTPQQDGVAERENRTLIEAARSMLKDANLPDNLWAEAVNCAAYALNRTTCKRTPKSTPYERWFGIKPNVSNLRVFGCTAYLHIEKKFRGKLDSKSKRAVFVGYCDKVNTYRFYSVQDHKVIISREALLNEDEVGGTKKASTNQTCNSRMI